MNYELAKALKDAGFVQNGKGTRVAPPDKIVVRRDDFAYVPTLEELIESCGDEFGGLARIKPDQWTSWEKYVNDEAPVYHAETPTEAVARLWLALNSTRYARHEAHSGKN
jgi:hypothetical protein